MTYTPPEVIHSLEAGSRTIVADPAADMWAFGAIAYELLTGAPIFPRGTPLPDVLAQLAGRQPLPWETSRGSRPQLRRLRRLRGSVLRLLERDPVRRLSAEQVVGTWNAFFEPSASLSNASRMGSEPEQEIEALP